MTENRKKLNEWKELTYQLIGFTYKGKSCGIDPVGGPGKSNMTYKFFYGDKEKDVYSFAQMEKEPFFDGKTLDEIIDSVKIEEY